MPRAARKAPGGQVYHVLNRSVGKMHLFGKDADFEAFQRVVIEAHQRHPIRILSYCVLSNRWHFAVWPDADGQVTAFSLAGTHASDALEGRAPDRRVRSSVSGTVQELPGAERRTSVDRLAVHRAECCGGWVGRAGGALALERPVGEDAWRRCDQGHLLALAGGTPRGLDRSRECAAEREGIRARAGEHREGPTVRRRRVGEADGERAEVGAHHSSGGPATQAEELAASPFRFPVPVSLPPTPDPNAAPGPVDAQQRGGCIRRRLLSGRPGNAVRSTPALERRRGFRAVWEGGSPRRFGRRLGRQ